MQQEAQPNTQQEVQPNTQQTIQPDAVNDSSEDVPPSTTTSTSIGTLLCHMYDRS